MKRIFYRLRLDALAPLPLAVFLAFLIVPAVVLAQDEDLTLAGLAEQLTALADRVTAIEARLAPTTEDGACVQYSGKHLQRETTTAYLDAFDEDMDSNQLILRSVRYDTEAGLTNYHFELIFDDRLVIERWRGCEFAGHSEWIEEE